MLFNKEVVKDYLNALCNQREIVICKKWDEGKV